MHENKSQITKLVHRFVMGKLQISMTKITKNNSHHFSKGMDKIWNLIFIF